MNSPNKQTKLKAIKRLLAMPPQDRKEVLKRTREILTERAKQAQPAK